MTTLRPADPAREHGISAQAVRNHERDGFIPPAERTPSGYRIYTEVHAAALRAFLALVPAYGHATAGRIMHALHHGGPDEALAHIDRGHSQSLRDRATLDAVRSAVAAVDPAAGAAAVPDAPAPGSGRAPDSGSVPSGGAGASTGTRTVGEVARRLGVTPATLRGWEAAGILAPARDPGTGYRVYRAEDVRDAELAHLLRRGGYPPAHVSTVLRQVRTAGGTGALAASLADWQRRLTLRGLAMLDAAALLSRYLDLLPVTREALPAPTRADPPR
ncbi:MerR family transcriptional regulator [Streptomyces sp. NPDC089799]|uniref:MerR family transcriptional regulator n=1 Tax=Streptomyces sp. NPDC089799 TaxID=3155066 RepID=UPI003420F2DD